MREKTLAYAGLARHGLIETGLGGAVALAALTVAHASLPDFGLGPPSPPAAAAILPAAPARPPPRPALIAFQPPLPDGEVGSPFGLRRLPWEAKPRLHAGLDMEAPAPEPVLAAADGVVSRIGEDAGYGRFVELQHADGLTTLYGHLARFAEGLAPGVAVKAGAPVGRLGSSGTSTGVHLHFEIHDAEGRPLNPELLLGRTFARAKDLPLAAARRIPRRVREAYVSHIPRSKLALMQARLEPDAETDAPPAESGDAAAASAAAAPVPGLPGAVVSRGPHHRVHVRLRL